MNFERCTKKFFLVHLSFKIIYKSAVVFGLEGVIGYFIFIE